MHPAEGARGVQKTQYERPGPRLTDDAESWAETARQQQAHALGSLGAVTLALTTGFVAACSGYFFATAWGVDCKRALDLSTSSPFSPAPPSERCKKRGLRAGRPSDKPPLPRPPKTKIPSPAPNLTTAPAPAVRNRRCLHVYDGPPKESHHRRCRRAHGLGRVLHAHPRLCKSNYFVPQRASALLVSFVASRHGSQLATCLPQSNSQFLYPSRVSS